MAACPGRSYEADENEGEEGATRNFGEAPPNSLPLQRVQGILDRMSAREEASEQQENEDDQKLLKQSGQIKW